MVPISVFAWFTPSTRIRMAWQKLHDWTHIIGSETVAMILGDNIFSGHDLLQLCQEAVAKRGASIFAYHVDDPERFDVSSDGKQAWRSIEESCATQIQLGRHWPLFLRNDVVDIAALSPPSARGELKITAVNNIYLQREQLHVCRLGRGYAWLDTGTYDSLHDTASLVRTVERRQGIQIACLEEIALKKGGFIRHESKTGATAWPNRLCRLPAPPRSEFDG